MAFGQLKNAVAMGCNPGIVGGNHGRGPILSPQFVQQLDHVGGGDRIKVTRRLIRKQEPRSIDQLRGRWPRAVARPRKEVPALI